MLKLSDYPNPMLFDGTRSIDLDVLPCQPFMLWDKLQLCLSCPAYETLLPVTYVNEFLHLIDGKGVNSNVIDESDEQGQGPEAQADFPISGHG